MHITESTKTNSKSKHFRSLVSHASLIRFQCTCWIYLSGKGKWFKKSTVVKSTLGNPLCERSIRDRAKIKIIKLLKIKQLSKDILSILKSKKRLRNWNQNKNKEYTIQILPSTATISETYARFWLLRTFLIEIESFLTI